MDHNIPKTIHYFWFGNNEPSELIKKCIKSWKKYCPNYQIIKWDESNFDINICPYVQEAYKTKNWAYVSDYARFYVLNKYGGLYLDTDVELIRPIDPIVQKGPFFALETEKYDSVNPGIGMASWANNSFYEKIIKDYNNSHFLNKEGIPIHKPVGQRVAAFLKEDGLRPSKNIQTIDGIKIYPKDYFCPLNYFTGEFKMTKNTVAIHHYASSWMSDSDKKYHQIGQKVSRILGVKSGKIIESVIRFPSSFREKVTTIGLKKSIVFYYEKYIKKE